MQSMIELVSRETATQSTEARIKMGVTIHIVSILYLTLHLQKSEANIHGVLESHMFLQVQSQVQQPILADAIAGNQSGQL